MYRGSNPIARTSQQNIADALVRLLQRMPYSSITISGICREADVSRQTFYSLFSSRENIVLYLLDTCHTFEPGKECHSTLSLRVLSQEYASYLIDKRVLLSLLQQNDLIYLLHGSLYDSFMNCSCFLPGQNILFRIHRRRPLRHRKDLCAGGDRPVKGGADRDHPLPVLRGAVPQGGLLIIREIPLQKLLNPAAPWYDSVEDRDRAGNIQRKHVIPEI